MTTPNDKRSSEMKSKPRPTESAPATSGPEARRGFLGLLPGRRASSSGLSRKTRLRLALAATALVGALGLAALASASHEVVDYIGTTSGSGNLGGEFFQPRDVAVNRTGAGPADQGDFYVADDINHRIQRFDSDGEFVSAWGADVALPAGGNDFEICTDASNCKNGVASGGNGTAAGNGTLANPQSVAVDGDTGNVYVSDRNNRRINVYEGDGTFLRSFGFDVAAAGSGNTGTGYEICVAADGDVCKAGVAGAGVGQYGAGTTAGGFVIAVSPADGDANTGTVFLADTGNRRVGTYDLDGQNPASFGSASEFGNLQPRKVAVDSRGIVYASDSNNAAQVHRYDTEDANGDGVGFLDPITATNSTPSGPLAAGPVATATSGLAVDPTSDILYVLRVRTGDSTAIQQFGPVNEPGQSAPPADQDEDHGSEAGFGAVNGFGLDDQNARFYVTATNDVGGIGAAHRVYILAEAPPLVATINPVTTFDATSATFTGQVNPNGAPTAYRFEYVTDAQFQQSGFDDATRLPAVDVNVGSGTSSVAAERTATGLKANTTYRVRLVANRIFAGDSTTAPIVFTTATDRPAITEQIPLEVGETEATLRAKVNPNGLNTTYHFQLGTDASYGTRIPANHDPFIGSGSDPVTVTANLDDLDPDSVYHFRVVATNADGVSFGPDRRFSTLNEEGLAWGRRFELVSPPDKGAAGLAGQAAAIGGAELQYQASTDGDSLMYVIAHGLEDTTHGGEVAYHAKRTADGWLSAQVSPSMVGAPPNPLAGESSTRGKFNLWVSSDLTCAFSVAWLNLTEDPVAQPVIDAGGANLYRRNPDGSHDLVTDVVPVDPSSLGVPRAAFGTDDLLASESCDRVIFRTVFSYPGMPITFGESSGSRILYEWVDGELRNPAAVPGLSGPEHPTRAWPGATNANAPGHWNALSDDGSRFFFTTTGAGTSNPLGRQAIFVRDGDEPAVDITESQTATATTGDSRYQMATPDGEYAFFIARYGIAPNATSTGATSCTLANGNNLGIGCGLYRYEVDTGELLDISASSNPEDTSGASVAGVLHASDDGSRVYFAAKGQLVAGEGQTFAENNSAADRGYNLYLWDDGDLSYVATVNQTDVTTGATTGGLLVSSPLLGIANNWASRTTPDGSHLVFVSTAAITGPSGVRQAYRYSADTGEVECVSCRRDGGAALGAGGGLPIPTVTDGGNEYSHLMPTISDDGSTVFFRTQDPLAPDAVEGQVNHYEWREGQVTLMAPDIPGINSLLRARFMGASTDGSTVFFRTTRSLVPHDTDGRMDIYAARVGGGFPPPPPPPPPLCDILAGACQGAAGDAPAPEGEATSTQPTPPAAEREARDCSQLQRQARQARQRARSLRQRMRGLRQRANRQARRGSAQRAQRLRQRANRAGRRMRSQRQRAQRMGGRAQACREAQGEARASTRSGGSR